MSFIDLSFYTKKAGAVGAGLLFLIVVYDKIFK